MALHRKLSRREVEHRRQRRRNRRYASARRRAERDWHPKGPQRTPRERAFIGIVGKPQPTPAASTAPNSTWKRKRIRRAQHEAHVAAKQLKEETDAGSDT